MTTVITYLVSHTNSKGTGIGQTEIKVMPDVLPEDMTQHENVRRQFAMLYPERELASIALKES